MSCNCLLACSTLPYKQQAVQIKALSAACCLTPELFTLAPPLAHKPAGHTARSVTLDCSTKLNFPCVLLSHRTIITIQVALSIISLYLAKVSQCLCLGSLLNT